ncbi:hypothetical protein JKP88DRAFT_40132 [Tribonema minus]|uniref:Ribosomal protein/NADH dehydrogenase domain-containing protein n=1 Tax=Tribonema minus TaxID=303371 RepID=A0A835Z2Z9_9STRA|nr:hypothetical protein JKP88DRAFT_40132 [Tribonema minus]
MSWRAGIGRQLREVMVCLAVQGDGASAGVRNWCLRRTAEIKMLNPNFPFFLREGDSIDPFMVVEFDWGKQQVVDLSNLTEKQVDDALKQA